MQPEFTTEEELQTHFANVRAAANPHASEDALLLAVEDASSVVCATALWNLHRLKKPFWLAIPQATGRALKGDRNDWYLRCVIAELHESVCTLTLLAQKEEWSVELALLNRQSGCPKEVLKILAKSSHKDIAERANKKLSIG
ncbi:MAG: hypothetical protein KGJ34_01480 [Patescibacteria group bacterium]|nr:hypothetical protein [Patescibacteria group bacterium]